MKTVSFRAHSDLIRIAAMVVGPAQIVRVRLAVDTAAAETIVRPRFLQHAGYGDRDIIRRTIVRSVIGSERGHLLHVARFTALGFSIRDFPVHAFELPPGHHLDGLLGLNFLRHFNYEIRSIDGLIRIERAVAI